MDDPYSRLDAVGNESTKPALADVKIFEDVMRDVSPLVDTLENFDGLERLMVMAVGLDAVIDETGAAEAARAGRPGSPLYPMPMPISSMSMCQVPRRHAATGRRSERHAHMRSERHAPRAQHEQWLLPACSVHALWLLCGCGVAGLRMCCECAAGVLRLSIIKI